MKGKVTIGPIKFEADIDSDNPEIQEKLQKLLDNHAEAFEAVITKALGDEILRLLPGITVSCSGTWLEDGD